MFEAWGRILVHRRRLALAVTLLFVALAGVWGTGVFGKLSSGDDFTPPDSPSQHEANQAEQVFGRNDADVVVLYRSATMTVADPAYQQAVTAALASLPRADVAKVGTYWSTGSPNLVSTDRHSTYAVLQLTGADDAARHQTYNAIKDDLDPASLAADGVTARVGGNVATEVAINNEVTADIAKAEGFSMPVLLILLLMIFGSLAAAAPPGGDRRHRHPGLVHCAAAAHLGHYGVDLLGEHHHDPGPGPGHRLRAVHGHPVPRGTAPPAHGRTGRGADGRDRGPYGRGVRGHGGGRADQPDAVPGELPALDGVRRGGHRRGGRAGRADRTARAAGRPRPPGQRAAGPPLGPAAGGGQVSRARTRPAGPGTGWPAASCAGRWSTSR